MSRTTRLLAALLALAITAAPAAAQEFPTDDPVIQGIWDEGMNRSQVYPLMQALLDSIGPRLTGTPGLDAAHNWLVGLYGSWGIDAENQQYGTWKGWERGITHVDLIAPRVRTLDATLLAWSPGTDGAVDGDVVLLPEPGADVAAWLEQAGGAFVLLSPPEPTCRPLDQWEELGDEQVADGIVATRAAARELFAARLATLGDGEEEIIRRLADAGVAGLLTSNWSGGYGARRIFGDRLGVAPMFSVSCEDFGLLYRLAEAEQGPRLRADARVQMRGRVPVFNTIATIPGTERPDEYVLLSAHLDSWDGGSGATDNGTGTIVMAEAMRLLNRYYPSPKRTIMVGHWGSEEQGLNGSRAFAADHPEVVAGLQAVFNQDNGTGKISRVGMQGLLDAGSHFAAWLSAIPAELTDELDVSFPGTPGGGGSDYAAFTCAGAPSFGLWSESWDYGTYTWHTNLDTLDKLAFDNVRHNAVLIAMLAYMASEDPELVDRERRTVMPVDRRTGERMEWPSCREPDRRWEGYGQ
ncbi:MAG: M20/M25/M40 family metallo-hydrolase [Candidatus Longimicrobiales bacterium M2_2A_002]